MEFRRHFWRCVGAVTLLNATAMGVEPDATSPEGETNRADPVTREMLDQDSILAAAFTAAFEIHIERNLLGPDKGRHTKVCHYTASDSAVGLVVETKYETDPPYRTGDSPGYRPLDFDADGNLIVWRSVSKLSFSTADLNRTYDEQETMIIAPNGTVLSRTSGATVYEYPVGSRANLYEFDQFRMGAGRGFTSEVQEPKKRRTLISGIEELVFDARFGPELRGDWHLYVDTTSTSLVRQADRFDPKAERPSLHVENNGVIQKDGLVLAKEASLLYAIGERQDYILRVTVVDFSAQADKEKLGRLRALVTEPFPPGTKILDHTALFPPH